MLFSSFNTWAVLMIAAKRKGIKSKGFVSFFIARGSVEKDDLKKI
jgi:hypothetical protein